MQLRRGRMKGGAIRMPSEYFGVGGRYQMDANMGNLPILMDI